MKVLFYGDTFEKMRDVLAAGMGDHEVNTADGRTVAEKIVASDILVARLGAPAGLELLRSAPRLRLLQQWGAGVEDVDFGACRELGIAVCNVPSRGTGNAESVAEIALLHMLLLGRKYAFAAENARTGRMFSPQGTALWKKKACVVGLGNLGRTVAERLASVGMTVRGVNRSPVEGAGEFFPLSRLNEAVAGCRFVVAALALAEETRGIFGEAFFRAMDRGAFFINVARGALADESALLRALDGKHLAGAGLDVLTDEPPSPDSPLLRHPAVTLTPHVGGVTDESVKGAVAFIKANADRVQRGEEPLSRQG
ncbi:MAG: 2-hydroxyacid dehydrogenase [Synergistaceae bacterium]|jgi:phosphoglycerate dehydrogenase-like enzyme|nr:2-hydroxyacid dehydrogenase [Synergistaceae bacterium]